MKYGSANPPMFINCHENEAIASLGVSVGCELHEDVTYFIKTITMNFITVNVSLSS